MARCFLSEEAAAVAGAAACEPPPHLDRDQRHLLRLAEAGELSPLAQRDAGRFRLLGQGPARGDASQSAGRVRAVDRVVLFHRRARAAPEARTDLLAIPA